MREADKREKIRQAYVNAAPDICDAILIDCSREKGQVIIMEETKKNKKTLKYLMAAAVCLVFVMGGGFGLKAYRVNYRVDSTVSLEVNPSLQILVNEKEKVLDVKALNRDGEIVIGDMDLSHSDVNVAVNALVGSMLRNGYLNDLANSILISVDNDDSAKGALLQEKLTNEVNEMLKSDGFPGAVLSQTITGSADLQQLADRYGITFGKAQLIQDILDGGRGYTFEELVPFSINELNLLIEAAESEIEKVSAVGNASDKAYIGEEKVKEIALAHAGLSEGDISFYRTDMDVERGVLVYEIDFYCGGYEYEFDIDARTGEVVKNKISEAMDQYENPAQNGADGSENNAGAGSNANTGNGAGTSASITVERAKEIALNHAGQTADAVWFEKAKQDYDDGLLVYEIEFVAGNVEYEYEINAQTGDIVKNKREMEDTLQNENAGNTTASIAVDQAKEIALNHAGQTADAVWFEKAKQDYDDGLLVYEIEFIAGNVEYEYEIDAQTGVVLDYEWDYD